MTYKATFFAKLVLVSLLLGIAANGAAQASGTSPNAPTLTSIDGVALTPSSIAQMHTHEFTGLPLTDDGWTDLVALFNAPGLYEDSRIIYVSSSDGDDSTGAVYTRNDAALGLNPFHPVGAVKSFATSEAAYGHLRDGYPDLILFKRGDTFLGGLGAWYGGDWEIRKGGRSKTERMIFGAYGSAGARPVFDQFNPSDPTAAGQPTSRTLLRVTRPRSYLVFADLAFTDSSKDEQSAHFRAVTGSRTAIMWQQPAEHVLFEGIHSKFKQWELQSIHDGYYIDHFVIRRNVIERNYSMGGGHNQGIFLTRATNVLVEENVFDHNGWHESWETLGFGNPTIFNHNIYSSDAVVEGNPPVNPVYRNNIFARASSNGMQLRNGGDLVNNLFVDNAIAGFIANDGGVMSWNVVLGGRDIDSNNPRGFGLGFLNAKGPAIGEFNVVSNKNTDKAGGGNAFEFVFKPGNNPFSAGDKLDITFRNNVVYSWRGDVLSARHGDNEFLGSVVVRDNYFVAKGDSRMIHIGDRISLDYYEWDFRFWDFANNRYQLGTRGNAWQNLGVNIGFQEWIALSGENDSQLLEDMVFPDPGRDLEDYLMSIAEPGTREDFLKSAAKMSRWNYDRRFTAPAVNAYVREGYGLPSDPEYVRENR